MKKYSRIPTIENQLTGISNKIQVRYFPELLPLSVKINTRITSSLARIFIPGIHSDPRIEFNIKHYQRSSLAEIKDILKHEYIHYQLYHKGKPYRHGIQFAKIVYKMELKESFMFDAKYIEKCRCGYQHWSSKKKNMNSKCPCCGNLTRIRKRF